MATSVPPVAHDPALALARKALYRFSALSLLDPRAGSWTPLQALRGSELLRDAAELIRSLPETLADPLGPRELPLSSLDPLAVLAQLPVTESEWNREYEQAFGLLVTHSAPPYEMEYIPHKQEFQRSNTLADVAGFYRAFGLALTRLHPERPDHIVQELEFMAYLISLEMQATEQNDRGASERAQICRQAQIRFLREHLAWWVPAFGKLLARECSERFFGLLGAFLAAWIAAERGLLGVPAPTRQALPSAMEPPDACAGCLA